MSDQVIESIDLNRPGQLGGKTFEQWLNEWARRRAAGEPIQVLIDRDSTHAVVIRKEP